MTLLIAPAFPSVGFDVVIKEVDAPKEIIDEVSKDDRYDSLFLTYYTNSQVIEDLAIQLQTLIQ